MLGNMTIQRMDNVAVVVDDLDSAVAFFTELGMELEGKGQVEGLWADRTVGLDGVRSDIAMMRTPDGHNKLELTKYHTPAAADAEPQNPPPNTLGLHLPVDRTTGFRPSGRLGQIKATPLLWLLCRIKLQGSSAFNDLQEGSQILAETRKRTEDLIGQHSDEMSALRAHVLWANPENIVVTERYATDYSPCSADGTDRLSVCKPDDIYQIPWRFVETGHL